GSDVVGSPVMTLLKQEAPLTCGAQTPEAVDPECPAFRLLAQDQPPADALETLFTLEAVRAAFAGAGVWERMAAAGLPREEIAVLWSFPIHSGSVAELDPSAGLVPRVEGPETIRIAVHGPVDPDTIASFVVRERAGSVVLMDLTEAAAG